MKPIAVGAGLGTSGSFLPINEQQNPPYLTDHCSTKPALIHQANK